MRREAEAELEFLQPIVAALRTEHAALSDERCDDISAGMAEGGQRDTAEDVYDQLSAVEDVLRTLAIAAEPAALSHNKRLCEAAMAEVLTRAEWSQEARAVERGAGGGAVQDADRGRAKEGVSSSSWRRTVSTVASGLHRRRCRESSSSPSSLTTPGRPPLVVTRVSRSRSCARPTRSTRSRGRLRATRATGPASTA